MAVAIYARYPASPQPFLWLDEAWRAYSVAHTGGLSSFLAYMSQNGEVMQLSEWVLAKTSWMLFGTHPFGFRVWPVLFSLAAIAGAFAFMGKAGHPELGTWPAFTLAAAFTFVYHGREFKPYALDLALTLWTLWAALHAVQTGRWKPLFALLGLLSVSSLVFLFIYPGVLFFCLLRARREAARNLALLALPPILFIANYLLFLRPQNPGGTSAFWAANYPTSLDAVRSLAARYPDYLRGANLHGWLPVTLAYLVLLPVLAVVRRNAIAVLLLAPLAIHIPASVFRLYPLLDRPSCYLYGIMVIGMAVAAGESVDALVRHPARARILKWTLLLLIVLIPLLNGTLWRHLTGARAWPPDTGRAAMQVLRDEYRADDHLILGPGAYYTFLFHRIGCFPAGHPLRDWPPPPPTALQADHDRASVDQSVRGMVAKIGSTPRTWFFSAFFPHTYQHYSQALSAHGQSRVRVGEPMQTLVEFSPAPPP